MKADTEASGAPAEAPARVRRYRVGQQQIVLGDCLRVLRRMAAGSVDVIVTSPL